MPNLPARLKGRTGVNLGRTFPRDHTAFVLPQWQAESSAGGLVPGLQFLKGPGGPCVPRIIPVYLYHLFIHLYTVHLAIHLLLHLFLSIYPSTCLSSRLFIYLHSYYSSTYPPTCPSSHTSVYL